MNNNINTNIIQLETELKRLKLKLERYPLCTDQPAQIDCRVEKCYYYTGSGTCSNISPAITLDPNGKFICWSEKKDHD